MDKETINNHHRHRHHIIMLPQHNDNLAAATARAEEEFAQEGFEIVNDEPMGRQFIKKTDSNGNVQLVEITGQDDRKGITQGKDLGFEMLPHANPQRG
jgi:hypothetical protein